MSWDDEDERMPSDEDDGEEGETKQVGSDELLADENLRLPEDASILVRVHAVRAWLARRLRESELAVGEAALAMQMALSEEQSGTTRPRRRMNSGQNKVQHLQEQLSVAQERLRGYEEAQRLFEQCVDHVTASERVLVEYYLMLDALLQDLRERTGQNEQGTAGMSAYLEALADVQHRIEHVVVPEEE